MDDGGGSSVVIRTESCPKCGSRDNVKRYADGHAHCFTGGCGYHEKATEGEHGANGDVGGKAPRSTNGRDVPMTALVPNEVKPYGPLDKRGLTEATLRRFGYFLGAYGGETAAHVYTVYDQTNQPVLQKIRMAGKKFSWLKLNEDAPSHQTCRLFGMNVFGEKGDRKVIVTTGELDAMTIAQETGFKYPVFSVLGGDDSAYKELQANYRELDRYQEIILWFDNDESGQRVVKECASLFEVGKVKIAKVEGFKDASEIKQAGRPGDILPAIYAAVTWSPEGIVNAADCLDDLLDEEAFTPTYVYKWGFLNDMLKGLYKGQVVYLVAGTGRGKTTLLFDQEIDWLRQGAKIGHCGFEDMRADVQIGLLSAYLGRRLLLQPLPRDELIKAHKELFGGRMVELFDPETAQWGMEPVFKYIRYMVKALECDIIIVDPLSFIAAGIQGNDKVAILDSVAQRLSLLAKEIGCNIIISHHLKRPEKDEGHENGAEIMLAHLRGSGSLANFASSVIAIEGDQQGEDPTLRTIRVLKNRKIGPTGIAGTLSYDVETGVFTDINSKSKAAQGSNSDY